MAVTEGLGEGSTAGPESSRPLSGRRKLRVQRGMSSRAGASGAETPVINLVSSGDEGSGDDAGGSHVNHDDGVASTRTQQELPNTPRVRRTGNQVDLTPNFRSAAAMAGWDEHALFMAAIGRGTPEAPSCTNSCEDCPQCRDRKRATRTPGQAATPLSAGRRHRRVRRVNEEPLVPIPMAVFGDEGEKRGEPAREAEGSHQQPSKGKENKDTKARVITASVKAEAAEGNAVKNDSLQLDKLREELTCVVCLDICFEPSTTSCGHSFCRGCLQSVYIKCGMRCPKCRQELRTTSKNDCPINTVLWNTIQLLFPQETAARLKDQKYNREKDNQTLMDSARTVEAESQLRLGLVRRRITRPVPWRELGVVTRGTEQSRPNTGGASESLRWRGPGNQGSFRRASEVLDTAQSALHYPHGFLRLRGRRPTTSSYRNPEIQRQEEEDAALAARLQESFISEAGL